MSIKDYWINAFSNNNVISQNKWSARGLLLGFTLNEINTKKEINMENIKRIYQELSIGIVGLDKKLIAIYEILKKQKNTGNSRNKLKVFDEDPRKLTPIANSDIARSLEELIFNSSVDVIICTSENYEIFETIADINIMKKPIISSNSADIDYSRYYNDRQYSYAVDKAFELFSIVSNGLRHNSLNKVI
ncbi:MAG: hypothetical protein Kapaf2KO_06980 [Candidatus Kapaibacteriales bacterium]